MERDKKGQSIKNNKKLLLNILTIQKDIVQSATNK